MSFTPEYRDSVEELLSSVVPIRSKVMFGGVGIYSEDLFFALIAEDRLYFKVDDTNRPFYEKAGSEPFYPYDSPTPMGYWELPEKVFKDKKQLREWIDMSLRVATSSKKNKKKN